MQRPRPSFRIISETHHLLSKMAAVYFHAHLTTVRPFFRDADVVRMALSKSWENSSEEHAAHKSVFTHDLEFSYPTTGMVRTSHLLFLILYCLFHSVSSYHVSLL